MASKKLSSGEWINVGRAIGQIIKFCYRCNRMVEHHKHKNEDEDDRNIYHFCKDCGEHN